MQNNKPKAGMTSLEAAALILSNGHTTDLKKAEAMQGTELNMDGLQRSHLRRMMGFDFELQILPNVVLATSKEKPFVRTRCKVLPGEKDEYGNIISEALIDRIVDTCARLKVEWDKSKAKK